MESLESKNSISGQSDYEDSSGNEELEDYKVDGYHPVVLGEHYNTGKYQILQKLGWGYFSTVWLVLDKKITGYYALKILKSKKSYTEAAQDELDILSTLKNKSVEGENHHVVKLIDSFTHFGIHGKHICIVFEIMGPNLLDLIQHFEDIDELMPIWLVKLITKQILKGLDFIHRVCGVIHTDIKPENVMIELEESSKDSFIKFISEFKKKPTSMKFLKKLQSSNSAKNKAKYARKKAKKAKQRDSVEVDKNELSDLNEEGGFRSSGGDIDDRNIEKMNENQDDPPTINNFDKLGIDENNEESKKGDTKTLHWKNLSIPITPSLQLKLVDFGNGCWISKHFTENIQTREYRSPEAIINANYCENTDIWSVACLVFEMLTNTFLFKPKKGSNFKKNDDHLALMMETLGKIPKHIALSGSRSREFFNKNGELLRIKALKSYPISSILEKDFKFDPDDCKAIEEFLLPMLEYDPKKRCSAEQALKSDWLSID